MKAFYKIILLLIIIVFSTNCGIFEPDMNIPAGYPTSYPQIGQAGIDSLFDIFVLINGERVCIKFDQFGRSEYPGCLDRNSLENITDSLRMISMGNSFLLKNSAFTGIFDTTDLNITSKGLGGHDDTVHVIWGVYIRKQVIEGITVLRSDVEVYLNSNGVIGTGGAWYKDIIVPSRDNYSASKAKAMIIGHKVTYFDWGGEGELTITRELIQDEVEKFVLPVYKDNELQLRVVWQITIGDNIKWYVYFDSITGEIVQTRQLWIS